MIKFILLIVILSNTGENRNSEELRREYVRTGMTCYTEGDYSGAVKYLKKAFHIDTTGSAIAYNIACCYSLMNNVDSAIVWIERTIDLGTYLFTEDSDFDNIRKTGRFKKLTEKASILLEEAKSRDWSSHVFVPESYDNEKLYPLIIMLHGYGSAPDDFTGKLKEFLTEVGYIYMVPYGTEVYGLKSFGWGSIEKVEEFIRKEIEDLKEKYSVDLSRVIIAGFSQGGYHSYSLGIRNPEIFRGVISIAGYFDREQLEGYLTKLEPEDLGFYIMIGEKEREDTYESNEIAKELLEERGIDVYLDIFPDVGHAFPGDPVKEFGKALNFILE